jgi:uncharacterized membrane protein YbaN (DUF454 family)
MKALKIHLLIICGTISVALAILGMIFPVLPTTPFLLLAAVCYGRSSPRFYAWLLNNRLFGKYIRNYREGKGILLKQKVFTLLLLWLTIGSTIIFITEAWWLRLLLLGIAIGVTIHLVSIRNYKEPDALPGVPVVQEME